jgi:hypothetical protein
MITAPDGELLWLRREFNLTNEPPPIWRTMGWNREVFTSRGQRRAVKEIRRGNHARVNQQELSLVTLSIECTERTQLAGSFMTTSCG